jgi:hypothetical protein
MIDREGQISTTESEHGKSRGKGGAFNLGLPAKPARFLIEWLTPEDSQVPKMVPHPYRQAGPPASVRGFLSEKGLQECVSGERVGRKPPKDIQAMQYSYPSLIIMSLNLFGAWANYRIPKVGL